VSALSGNVGQSVGAGAGVSDGYRTWNRVG
jgi:hypothetical protein